MSTQIWCVGSQGTLIDNGLIHIVISQPKHMLWNVGSQKNDLRDGSLEHTQGFDMKLYCNSASVKS